MAKLTHPNVASVYDTGTTHGQLYVAMEFVEGVDLRGWLDETPRDWDALWSVFEEVGRGLAAAHKCGIVHRDFKPENVLVPKGDGALVTDFRLAPMPIV